MSSNTLYAILVILSFIWLPLIVDFIPGFRAGRKKTILVTEDSPTCEDIGIIVPIYGNIKYLLNIDFLSKYGDRVILATTDGESEEFYADTETLHKQYGFRTVRAHIPKTDGGGKRSTTAPIRDTIVREAIKHVPQKYVVCLDADSFPEVGFEHLAGTMEEHDMEVVSVTLLPSNHERLLAKLQAYEYHLSMNLRNLMPWLVSGGCHAATTEAYHDIMEHHSMFFQGNDVEVGLLAERLGYRVGHLDYRVSTEVPDTIKPWWRQRYAWAGGEYRIGVRNVKFVLYHPFFYFYLLGIMILMSPVRWYCVIAAPWILIPIYFIYLILVSILLRKTWKPVLFVYPIYTLLNSLVIIPLGLLSYFQMSIKHHNWGCIQMRPKRISTSDTGEKAIR